MNVSFLNHDFSRLFMVAIEISDRLLVFNVPELIPERRPHLILFILLTLKNRSLGFLRCLLDLTLLVLQTVVTTLHHNLVDGARPGVVACPVLV